MIEPIPWTERKFTLDQPVGVFPTLLKRLRGTPVRAAGLVAGLPETTLAARSNGSWSVKEHLGHLDDLQPLDDRRLGEFLSRVQILSPADMSNRATDEANHRGTAIAEILSRLSTGRSGLVGELEALSETEVAITALHPRLQKPMRLLDWAYFVAEHDDHHLAKARRVIRSFTLGAASGVRG